MKVERRPSWRFLNIMNETTLNGLLEFISQLKLMCRCHTWFRAGNSFPFCHKIRWLFSWVINEPSFHPIKEETIPFSSILFLFFFHFQKSCIDFAINATPLERYMPEERVGFKYRLWRIVESTPFEYFIMTLIVLNTILLMMKVSASCRLFLS